MGLVHAHALEEPEARRSLGAGPRDQRLVAQRLEERECSSLAPADRRLLGAGLAAGLAVLNNYAAILTVAPLTLYAAAVCRPRRRLALFLAGGLPPALALGWYHRTCFGRALTLATSHESKLFTREGGRLLGVFGAPDPSVLAQLLLSSYRGLFFSSPVLLLGAYQADKARVLLVVTSQLL